MSAPVGVVLTAKEREWLEYAVDQMAASSGPEDAVCYEVLHGLMTRVDTLAQQPAAVDGAMVERAAEAAWLEFKSGLEERSWERAPAVRKDRLRIIVRTALTAALAGQQQGGTPE